MESQNWQLITEMPYFYRGFNTPPTPLNRLLNQFERYYGPWQVIFRKSISKWMRSTIATIMAQKCDVHSLKITCLLHTGMSDSLADSLENLQNTDRLLHQHIKSNNIFCTTNNLLIGINKNAYQHCVAPLNYIKSY